MTQYISRRGKNSKNVLDIFPVLLAKQEIAIIATRHFIKLLGTDVFRNMVSLLKEDPDQVYMVSTRVYADIFVHRRVVLKSEISPRLHN